MFENRPVRAVSAVVLLVALCALGYCAFMVATRVELDLSPLDGYAESENFEALIARIQSADPPEDGFRFVALGDTRSFYHRALNVLTKAAKESPAFILSNGDIVRNGTVAEYVDHHLKLTGEIAHIPFIVAPGNHERGPNRDFAAFKALYGDVRFSFDYGNGRFVGINNGDRSRMGAGDLQFLETELSKPGAAHKFVVFHVPPEFLESALESKDSRGFSWNAKPLHQLMVRQKVDHVFTGHVHGFASELIDGVRYTITGGGGANLTEALGDEGAVHHFVSVHVSPDGIRNEVVKFADNQWIREEF
ncbi:MAG: metallophosphoesterase [Candidatus Hydrogenedentes bacterium]|jgi:3',5'-cyclic AMP phosphodiesterase CpdA|nr:metallophosphoesterase [Candidatus Hydrogenedentota bacterium]